MNKIALVHGDVTFVEVSGIPKTAKRVGSGAGYVVEKGEGVNTHVLESDAEVYMDGDTMYLCKGSEPIKVGHEEHGTQVVPAKFVRVVIERVYDYESEEARRVKD